MKKSSGLTIAALVSGALALTAGPGIAQDKNNKTRVVQSTTTAEANRQTSRGGEVSFREYHEAHRKAYAETARRLRERQEFEEKYLTSDE